MEKNVAILHDRIPGVGGAENVAIEIAKTLKSPLFTTYKTTDHYDNSDVEIITFKQNKYTKGIYKPLIRQEILETISLAFDFAELDLYKYGDYDIIFSCGMYSRGFIPKLNQYVINYINSPVRWVYDLYQNRMSNIKNPIQKNIYKIIAQWWRSWDLSANIYVDQFVANSDIIKNRIRKYWGRESKVIYPPIDTKSFKYSENEDYYLSINRLYPEKRIDLIIEAFKETNNIIKIIGQGFDKKYKMLAKGHNNIEFLGEVSDKDKKDLLSHCKAVIYIPMAEDFGIVPIESFASGKPVIGINEGYTKFQINDTNGVLINNPVKNELIDAIKRLEIKKWDYSQIQKTSEKYDIEEFRKKINKIVNDAETDEIKME